MPKYELENSLGFMMATATRAISNEIQRRFREGGYNVTPEHWTILVQLWNEDGLTQIQLAERTGKDEPCISRLIQNMLSRDLVIRDKDPADGRRRIIFLTKETKEQKEPLIRLVQQILDDAVAGSTEEEVLLTKQVLRRISENLS